MSRVIHTDVAIVGKGISGLVLSVLLSRLGVAHVLLERPAKAGKIALGETLPPSSLDMLKRLDLLDSFQESALALTYGYHSIWGTEHMLSQDFSVQPPFGHGLKLNREALLEALGRKSVAGQWVIRGLKNVSETAVGVELLALDEKGARIEIQSRIAVDASGRGRALLRALGIAVRQVDQQVAFSCHLPRPQPEGLRFSVFSESFAGGWGMVSFLPGSTCVMSLFTQQAHPFARQMRNYAEWSGILAGTRVLNRILIPHFQAKIWGGDANSARAQTFCGPHWLALGDAAMGFDPLSSHGISNGIYTAWRASEAIQAHLAGQASAMSGFGKQLEDVWNGYLQQRQQFYPVEPA